MVDMVETLVEKLKQIYPDDLVESNIRLLKDHVQIFCDETDKKEETILKKIESLHEEQAHMQRLLQKEKTIDLRELPLLSYQQELEEELENLRDELQDRKLQIKDLLLKQEGYCNVLDEPKLKLNLYEDPLSSAEEIEAFQKNLAYLHSLKIEREKTVTELRGDIMKLSKELEFPILDEPGYSLLNNTELTLSQYIIESLVQLETDLRQHKDALVDAISDVKKQLDILWNCLEVDTSIRKKFNAYNGCSQGTYDKLKLELNRCESEKIRHIKNMWILFLSSEEREKIDVLSEDLLPLHKLEIESVKELYDKNKKMFNSFNKHQELFKRMVDLETPNPDRLKNRGGILLDEEYDRNRIAQDLPVLRQEIIDFANAYEAKEKRQFTVNGKNIVEIVNGMHEKREGRKQLAQNRKRTPTSVNKSTNKRIPLATLTSNMTTKKPYLEVPGSSGS